ncbi:5'-3' exonuclease PLD3-like isoform X2 [Arctopsyche grandis]|uniref:5'-3' exonuclease PLD3-like isoform X2 n=1 Tax=Arctopsyche grandis TaxID=121162 RepID=UPI00406D8550
MTNEKNFSTVLETNTTGVEDDYDQWEQSFMLRQDQGSSNFKKLGSDGWCRPSCIPISIIMVLIVLVVLVPLLDHSNSVTTVMEKMDLPQTCSDQCRVSLVESIPEGLLYPPDVPKNLPTYETWLELINMAQNTVEIASFYWTLRENEVYPHNSSKKGEDVFQALYKAGTKRGITVNIAQSAPTASNPNTDTEILAKKKAAEVRSVNFPKLLGGGVLHTKFWIVDRAHFYIGSANMDWRSLTQVKELGIVGYNCSCLAKDLGKVFDVYWILGKEDSAIPNAWPQSLQTVYNKENPMNISVDNVPYYAYISSSPPPLSPVGRTNDLSAIVNIIKSAEKFVYISVMDYFPLMLYTPKREFWPHIDDAIRKVAIEDGVKIKMLISWWNHSKPSEDFFLRSLTALNNSYPGVDVQVKRFVVPATADQSKIPFARVNHNKYMVTDKVAYIGTSNWSGSYFTNTAGVGLVMEEPEMPDTTLNKTHIRNELQSLFERDWESPYALPLIQCHVWPRVIS